MKSKFNSDLSKESLLGMYLDNIYPNIFKGFNILRESDLDKQHKGIDIVITKEETNYFIDEKAQLDYIDKDLPTFAFEVSYIKDGTEKQGWLFDKTKLTNKYFLITAIYLNDSDDIRKGFKSCKITSVDREKLILLLFSKGLTNERIIELNTLLRNGNNEGAIPIKELNQYTEGKFYFSKSNKYEQPINIVLKIEFLIRNGVAKKII